ncbi:MAG: ABC transporter permease [Clostridiales bacterium]|jgi:ABC-2 type transport system permease protein|nr:ABC transporter permease [Clostridiales bacterium]MDR2750755.1 ABC transporter permease [Clostridiales bacterium]
MAIFKYEMRQLRSHTLWWAISISVALVLFMPAYINMLTSGSVNAGAVMDNGFFEMLGADAAIISTPLGAFGYVNSFFTIAAGINGMFLGLRIFTKETIQKTAEYIYTKPYKRSSIFSAKVLTAVLSSLAIGVVYYAVSVLSALLVIGESFDLKSITLIALSFIFIELFFVLFGACVGSIYSKIRTPLLASTGVVFMFYIFSAYASKVNVEAIKLITPFSYFGASKIVNSGGYNATYITALIVLCAAFAIIGFGAFVKKDITFIS